MSTVVTTAVCCLLVFQASLQAAETIRIMAGPATEHDAAMVLEKARNDARSARAQNPSRPIEIVLGDGTYALDRPLALDGSDGGRENAPTTWTAEHAGKTTISGGRRIEHWKVEDWQGHQSWVAELGAGRAVHELWVDGQRRPQAPFPKQGYLTVELLKQDENLDADHGVRALSVQGEHLPHWPSLKGVEAIVYSRWTESHLPVASIDPEQQTLHFSVSTVLKPDHGDLLVFHNVPQALSEPGEWTLEPGGKLRYLPMAGEKPEKVQAVVPALDQLVRVEGKPGASVQFLNFAGLIFSHAEWYVGRPLPASWMVRPAGFAQAEVGVPAAVDLQFATNCRLEHCQVVHCGTYAIALEAGCQHVTVDHCALSDLGAGGIKIGRETIEHDPAAKTSNNLVTDCTIANSGRLFPSAIGIWIGQSPGNQILHNDIHGQPYTGISIGWTWGYGESDAGGNLVQDNVIHHIGETGDAAAPVLSDMGGVYTLGAQPGTVIRHNEFHNVAARTYGGWGIYFDEGSRGIVAENNLVYRTLDAGFHQHYGTENIVRNNIFALGRHAQIQRSRLEDHNSFTFEHNIVCWNEGELLAGDWSKINAQFDHNTYWGPSAEAGAFGPLSRTQWQAAGQDAHSVFGKNRFPKPEAGDFSLPPDAQTAGFTPFPLGGFGPRNQ